jgi:hypothetical protein
MPRKKKVKRKKRAPERAPRKFRTDAEIRRIMKAYRKAERGQGAKILKKHGLSYSHVYFWAGKGF